MDNFTTVFLFTNNAFRLVVSYASIGFGLIFLLLGLWGISLKNYFPPILRNGYLISVKGLEPAFLLLLIFGCCALGIWAPLVIGEHAEYLRFQTIYNTNQYQIAEGIVHVIYSNEKGDTIKIGNVKFEISNALATPGYHTSILRGGALTEGTYARVFYDYNVAAIDYDPTIYTILRVDVKK